MKTSTALPKSQLPSHVIADAAVWVTKLHSSEQSPWMAAAFEQWSECPEHRRAFDAVVDTWKQSAYVLRKMEVARVRRRSLLAHVAAYGIAAMLLALCVSDYWFHNKRWVTAIGEQRSVMLGDGTKVWLNTDTAIDVQHDDRDRLVILEQGEACFHIAKESYRPFTVAAGDFAVTAVGTVLMRAEARKLTVEVINGTIRIGDAQTPPDKGAMLGTGLRVVLQPGVPLSNAIAQRTGIRSRQRAGHAGPLCANFMVTFPIG